MIPLVAPSYDASDRAAVRDSVESSLFGSGATTDRFEQAIAERVRGSSAQGTPSGTAALHLALVAAGVAPGDEVIAPSYTCIAVLHAIHLVGAIPILVDNLDEPGALEFNIDPDLASAAQSPRTRALIVPHAFGVTADLSQLLVHEGVALIEDCAMALGSERHDVVAGSTGRFATFSFHETKVISCGTGGMVVANDQAASEALGAANEYLEAQRIDRTAPLDAITGSYRFSCGYALTDLQSKLGLAQLAKLDAFVERRRQVAVRYNAELADSDVVLPILTGGGFPFRYQIDLSPRGVAPHEAIAALRADGIEAGRGVYPALHQYLGLNSSQFPHAERCTAHLLSLPVHPELTDADVEQVVVACKRMLEEAARGS